MSPPMRSTVAVCPAGIVSALPMSVAITVPPLDKVNVKMPERGVVAVLVISAVPKKMPRVGVNEVDATSQP